MNDPKKITLKELIQSAGKQLRTEFEELKKSNPHFAERGAEAEIILKTILKDRLPRRFDIETGFIVGADGSVSKQTDLIIFDAINSPIYRKGPRVYILPRDNVAAVIEVKTKLSKNELKDAAEKIASVKRIKPSPITSVDQPVTFSELITTNTLGCVFAYDSYTSLDSLAENLREINSEFDSSEWIDFVMVLDKGFIGYIIQQPFGKSFPGWFAGPAGDEFALPPYYVHLAKQESGSLTLNHFFVRLMAQLTFFRKRSSVAFASILGPEPSEIMSIQGYQYNLARQLVPAEESHYAEKFKNPHIRFNIYSKRDGVFMGQVCYLKWQDGAVITCSTRFDHRIVFGHFFSCLKLDGIVLPAGGGANISLSSVHPISEEDFIRCAESFNGNFMVNRDSNDDVPPPFKI